MRFDTSGRRVTLLVLRQGMLVVLPGLFVGWSLPMALTRLLAASLYGVTALDPFTFIAVPAWLLLTTMAACFVPARLASKIDPAASLRYE